MNKYVFLIIIILLLVFIRYKNEEHMYGSWHHRASYPLGSYDPAMAPGESTRRP